MKIGLGLPIAAPEDLLDWARRAEAGPFSTLGLLDRLVFDNPEPLVTLAALAGATSRIRLQTEILVAPVREPVLLAKQAATMDRMFPGRFSLGLGIGGRDDDYRVAGVDARGKGRRLDEQLAAMRRVWAGEPHGDRGESVGPAPSRPGGPELLFGAFKPVAFRRAARFGDGVVIAGPPRYAETLFRGAEDAWRAEGRTDRPRIVAQVSVALGPEPVADAARAALVDYYAFAGEHAEGMVRGLITEPERIRETVTTLTDLGADEVMLYCWGPDPDQIERVADVIG